MLAFLGHLVTFVLPILAAFFVGHTHQYNNGYNDGRRDEREHLEDQWEELDDERKQNSDTFVVQTNALLALGKLNDMTKRMNTINENMITLQKGMLKHTTRVELYLSQIQQNVNVEEFTSPFVFTSENQPLMK